MHAVLGKICHCGWLEGGSWRFAPGQRRRQRALCQAQSEGRLRRDRPGSFSWHTLKTAFGGEGIPRDRDRTQWKDYHHHRMASWVIAAVAVVVTPDLQSTENRRQSLPVAWHRASVFIQRSTTPSLSDGLCKAGRRGQLRLRHAGSSSG